MPLDRGWLLEPLCDFHFKIRETKNALSQSTPLNGLTAVKQHFQSNVLASESQERPSIIHLLVQWVVKMRYWTKRGLTYISPQATGQWLVQTNQFCSIVKSSHPSLSLSSLPLQSRFSNYCNVHIYGFQTIKVRPDILPPRIRVCSVC